MKSSSEIKWKAKSVWLHRRLTEDDYKAWLSHTDTTRMTREEIRCLLIDEARGFPCLPNRVRLRIYAPDGFLLDEWDLEAVTR